VSSFADVIEIIGGGTPKTSAPEYWDGDIPWFSVVDAPGSSDVFVIDTEKKITKAGLENSSTRILPYGTTIITARGTVGKCALVGNPMAMNQSCYGVQGQNGLGTYFTYYSIRNLVALLQQRTHGSVFDTITRDTFRTVELVVPPFNVANHFEVAVEPLLKRVLANLVESRTLAAIRDALLPKLISGEIRVRRTEDAATNVVSLPAQLSSKPAKRTKDEFIEAVVIAQLVRKLATPQYPLGRMRYNKLAYLAHRKAEVDVTQRYLKKAAGPYSPWAKYGGPEKIAKKNGYVQKAKRGSIEGLVAGKHINQIDRYVSRYPVVAAIEWVVDKFRFKKNDDLELLTTVDFAALDLLRDEEPVTPQAIKRVIATNKEWAPKLNRSVFSDSNISRALGELCSLFPATYQR
jgi:type I restriction enzyme S subunit